MAARGGGDPPADADRMPAQRTVRTKTRTGKYSRQLRSAWTDAWDTDGAPQPPRCAPTMAFTWRTARQRELVAEVEGLVSVAHYHQLFWRDTHRLEQV